MSEQKPVNGLPAPAVLQVTYPDKIYSRRIVDLSNNQATLQVTDGPFGLVKPGESITLGVYLLKEVVTIGTSIKSQENIDG